MKHSFLKAFLISIIFAALPGCALFQDGGDSGSSSGNNSEYEALISKAESAFKQVDSKGGAWSFTEEDLEAAKTAASKQDYATAIKLAKKIISESEIALTQVNSQEKAGPHLF